MPEINLIREFNDSFINQVKDAYLTKKTFDKSNNNNNGIELFQSPFPHGIISDLITDTEFLNDLKAEMKSELKYLQKNNDLYKFHQTGDLASSKLKSIRKFRDQILYGSVLKRLEQITNIDLSSKIDFTSSKYDCTDYLLCHDDDIHNDATKQGRRIAFIYYLVPDDWSAKDGGNLDLFNVDENLQPIEVCKSIQPKFNSLLFFEVSDRSFHQVAEVLSKSKTRYSINGWFHGEINHRPEPFIELIPEPSDYIDIEAGIFFDWITEKYLKPTNQTEIQLKFTSSSEIKLDNIFNSQKYYQISEALSSDKIVWQHRGPANRRNYQVAKFETLPDIVAELIKVLSSDHMGLTLSNMTGLALHSSVPKRIDDDDEDDADDYDSDDDDDDNDDDDNNDDGEEVNDEIDSDDEILKRKHESDSNTESTANNYDSKPGTSKSKSESNSKKLKTLENQEEIATNIPSTSSASNSNDTKNTDKPKCYYEIRKWQQGNYTLVTDNDNQIKTKALDLMLFFQCKSWTIESGGNVSYIARDEDSELLTVNPEENCLALVYRDEETLKFTKYVNSNLNECFYEISYVYYE